MEHVVPLKALKRQYDQAFGLLEEIVAKTSAEHWNSPGDDFLIPAHQGYHAVQALDAYLQKEQDTFDWNRFGIRWSKTPGEELLNQEAFKDYADEVKTKLESVIEYYSDNEREIAPDKGYQPWYPTVFDRLTYALRHLNHHLGMMSCELRRKCIVLSDPCW